MTKAQKIILAVLIIIVVIGVGGYIAFKNPAVSTALGLMPPVATSTVATSSLPTMAIGRQRVPGGMATGSIETLNDSGFTINLLGGTTKNILLTATTTIRYYATASTTPTTITENDLSVGEQVRVVGIPNSDGSISATRISAGTFPTGYGRAGGRPGATPSST